jgi:hypothetical protein
VLVTVLDDVKREAPSLLVRPDTGVELERKEEEVMVRGAGETIEMVEEAAEVERPMLGGGEGDDNAGVPGFEDGLFQDVKKSSSSSACDGGVGAASMPSTKMRSGYLHVGFSKCNIYYRFIIYLIASSLARFASSSLYSSATRLEYFFFVSESCRSPEPPCFVKNSFADAFPPTFIVRNWLSCQVSRFVDLYDQNWYRKTNEMAHECEPDKTDVHAHVTVHT